MGTFMDLTGQSFGKLTVLALASGPPYKWRCLCACGGQTDVPMGALRRGNTRSCGCVKRSVLGLSTTKHGASGTPLYGVWKSMHSRCNNPNTEGYKNYGARGIKVCERWQEYSAFLADMGPRPAGLSLERRDNNKGYSPDNCYWATRSEQNSNARSNILLTVGGITQTLSSWAREVGISKSTLKQRLTRGWPIEAACTLPRKGKVIHINSLAL